MIKQHDPKSRSSLATEIFASINSTKTNAKALTDYWSSRVAHRTIVRRESYTKTTIK
jgi:hypothetical protein